jgi:uroporphyrinogen decarboxylase
MSDALADSVFLKACRGERTSHTPIWLNRQAGRYMKEYHQVKGSVSSLEFFKTPSLAAQATCDAQRILGVDAAIMFADLLPVLEPMGLELAYLPGLGPKFANPLRDAAAIDALRVVPARDGTPYIAQTVQLIRAGLPANIPLIGFAGAPFTLASYAVEGQGSSDYLHTKRMMYSDAGAWRALMEKLVAQVADYVALQIDAGVQAVQIFDSWVGSLSVEDFREYVKPYTATLISQIRGRVPVIYFGTGNQHLLADIYQMRPDVLAFDWRTPLVATWDALDCVAVQGNLDPIILCSDAATIERQAQRLLNDVSGRAGHIFNLGHGIVPSTPVDNVRRLVDIVHAYRAPS